MTLYKFLTDKNKPTHGPRRFKWPIPNGKPGDWVEVKGALVPCQNGLHLVRQSGLVEWLAANLYEAEHEGESVPKDDHVIVCRKARLVRRVETWNDRMARLFAADCAERVLHIYEKKVPGDERPRRAIETARLFAEGKATKAELAAARDAAWAAAWAAARAAARDAAGAAGDAAGAAAWAAADAAGAAAGDAAGAAAWAAADAAGDAARDAERAWQRERLMHYLEGK